MEREKKESILKKWFISYTFWASTGGSSRATNLLINNAIIQCLNTWILQMKWNNNLKTTNCIRDVKWREKKTHTFGILMAICKKCTHSIIFNWNFCLRKRRKESKVWQSENDTRKWKCHLTFAHHSLSATWCAFRLIPPPRPATNSCDIDDAKIARKIFPLIYAAGENAAFSQGISLSCKCNMQNL